MRLQLKEVPKLTGETARARFEELSQLIEHSRWPIYMVGPSGSGKTVMAMNLAKNYSRKHDVPAYYAQLSPDQTKTSLILGLRLRNGSLVPVKGLVAEAMSDGGVVIIDEATHATQELLLMFNSICDRTAITAIGDETIIAKKTFRVMFCGNSSVYAGNVKLPQSFAQRMIAFNFDFPSREDEVKIGYKLFNEEYLSDVTIPQEAAAYVTSIVREYRSPKYPLSVRNIAASLIAMQVKLNVSGKDITAMNGDVLPNVVRGQAEAVLRKVYTRIHGTEASGPAQILMDEGVRKLLGLVDAVSVEGFREAIMSGLMYYLDVDGFAGDVEQVKERIASSVF